MYEYIIVRKSFIIIISIVKIFKLPFTFKRNLNCVNYGCSKIILREIRYLLYSNCLGLVNFQGMKMKYHQPLQVLPGTHKIK